jgi:predicted HicB family RNase H-like nuclease
MKKITFRIEEELLEQAQSLARGRVKTLNDLFCEWLQELVSQSGNADEVKLLMAACVM